MFKIKKKLLHKLISGSLLLSIGLSTTLTAAIPVYAEVDAKTEEEEKKPESYNSTTNNVAKIEDPNLKAQFKASSSYDISMQYLVTYNILKGGYLEGKSNYANIYTEDVSTETYNNVVGSSISKKVTTGAQNIILAQTDEESGINTSDTKDENPEESEAEKLVAKMSETAATNYMTSINKLYGMSDKGFAFDGDTTYIKDITAQTRTLKSKARSTSKESSTAMKASLVGYFKEQIGQASSDSQVGTALNLTPVRFRASIFNTNTSKPYNYFLLYSKQPGIGQHTFKDATNQNFSHIVQSEGYMNKINYLFTLSNFASKKIPERQKETKLIHQYTLAHTTKTGEDVQNAIMLEASEKTRKTANMKTSRAELAQLKDFKKAGNVKAGNIRTLSWTPLNPYYSDEIKGKEPNLVEALKSNDIIVSDTPVDGLLALDDNGKKRALQLGDLFFTKDTKASPVVLGPSQGSAVKEYIKLSLGGLTKKAAISNSSIGNFIGIKTNTNWLKEALGGVFTKFESVASDDLTNASVTRGTMKSITASGQFKKFTGNKTPMGIDNYGNIIAGETGEVVIPYWHNTMFLTNEKDGMISQQGGKNAFVSHPVYNTKKVDNKALYSRLDATLTDVTPKEASVNIDMITKSGLITDTSKVTGTIDKVQNELNSFNGANINTEKIKNLIQGQTLNQDESLQVLAVLITAGTYKSVEKWNKSYWDLAIEAEEAYVGLTAGDNISGGGKTDEDIARWTAASIIQKIGLIFDWGFAETIRITLADMMINFYNSSFASTGLTNIFYTPNVTESGAWTDMIEPLGLLLLAFTPIYILFMVFKVNRGTATAKDIIKQFIMLALIFLIPVVGYGAFTSTILNTPASWILGSQLKQTVVLDYFLDRQQERANGTDKSWAQLFGDSNEGNKLRTADNYILTLYTTTDKDGFEIDDPNAEHNTLNQIRKEALTRGADWNKNKLVSVNVSMFDLYNWATEQNKNWATGQGETNLFTWLEEKDSTVYKGVGSYNEYYTNTNTIFDTTNNAGGVLTSTTNGENITASEMFKRLHRLGRENENNQSFALRQGLQSLTELMNLFAQSQKEYYSGSEAYYVPSVDDLSSVMRDLSMVGSTRKNAFGTNEYSTFTRSVMEGNANAEYPLSIPVNIPKPANDIFGVYDTVKKLNPYLASGKGGGLENKSLEKMTYDINYDVMTQLANVYSMIPNSTNITSDNVDMGSALQMAVVSEIFFQINDEMGFKNFPKAYAPGTVSTDNYLKMVFIPFADYGINQANFKDSETMTNNVAEYLAERENSAVLLLFIIATLCLAIYGLFMLAVFYGFMLVLTLYSFILNYIIKNNYKNKSWLGVLGIYTVLGLVKFGLVFVWYVMTTILNHQYTVYGAATYPFVMIHAIVIIAYLFFVGKFVIVRLFSAVYKDKENLGGEAFSSSLSSMKNNLTAKTSVSRGRTRPMGNVAGNSKRKFGNMSRGTGKYVRGAGRVGKYGGMAVAGAGLLGIMGGKALANKASDTTAVKAISNKISTGTAKYRGGRMHTASQAVGRGTRNFGRGLGEFGRGAKSFGYTIAHPFKAYDNSKRYDNKAMNYKNNAQKSILTKNLGILGEVPKAVNGVAASAYSVADTAGKIYGTKEAATATMMTLGSVAAAQVFAKGLESAGRLVKTEGKQVFVESTTDDLNTVEGRAALVDEGVTNIQNQADKHQYNIQDTKLKGSSGKYPVMYGLAANGAYNMLFSDKSGLDTRFYEKMTNNKEFRENFTVDPSTVNTYADGRIKPDSQIKVIPKSSSMTNNKAQKIFQNLYREDNKFRTENDYSKRKGGEYNSLSLKGVSKAEREEYLKDAPKGVMLNETGLIYKHDNRDQREYVENLKSQMQEKTTYIKDSLGKDRDNLISYVKEGEGHGLVTKTYNSKDDTIVNQMFGDNVSDHSITFNTGDKHDTEQISSFVSSIQNLENVSKDDRKNFNIAQSLMQTKGKEVMFEKGTKDAVEKSISFLSNKHSIKNTTALNSIVNTKELIDTDLAKGAITPKQADVHYNQLFDNSLKLADDSNYINDMLRQHASIVDTKVTDNFNSAKEVMTDKYKINSLDLDKIKWDDNSQADYKDAFGGIKKFKVEDNIGRIESKDKVKSDKVSKLVEKATGKSFKEKSYATGYKPKTDINDDIVKPTDVKKVEEKKSDKIRKRVMNIED